MMQSGVEKICISAEEREWRYWTAGLQTKKTQSRKHRIRRGGRSLTVTNERQPLKESKYI